ncbi:MAG: Rieske (2Fe-2S) protein [Pirellulales bacterium]|nr:Rieske (2Fe-2S) protein [Pirellulales bacterium]
MTDSPAPLQERRGFLAKLLAIVGGGAALLAPTALGAVSFFNPLRQKGRAGGFFKLATLDVLPDDGTPLKIAVVAERVDAWNRYPNESIGAVYLRRAGKKDVKVEALQVVCPHAGCSIMFEPGEKSGKFFCPCHNASFDLAGVRTDRTSPSPRDMDALEAEIRNGDEVWVKFQTFATGTSRKTAQS